MAIPKHIDSFSESNFDEEKKKAQDDTDDYNRTLRCGIDDPLPVKDIADYEARVYLLHVMVVAYDVNPKDLIEYLKTLYPECRAC
jgi:hypothetical protein